MKQVFPGKDHIATLHTLYIISFIFFSKILITITNPGGLVIIVTLTKHENKWINKGRGCFPFCQKHYLHFYCKENHTYLLETENIRKRQTLPENATKNKIISLVTLEFSLNSSFRQKIIILFAFTCDLMCK